MTICWELVAVLVALVAFWAVAFAATARVCGVL